LGVERRDQERFVAFEGKSVGEPDLVELIDPLKFDVVRGGCRPESQADGQQREGGERANQSHGFHKGNG
jgi:hypothetical protein